MERHHTLGEDICKTYFNKGLTSRISKNAYNSIRTIKMGKIL